MYRTASPYRGASPMLPPVDPSQSPYQPPSTNPYPPFNSGVAAPPQPTSQGSDIQPGSITYTKTTDAEGRIIYHPFKAVPARSASHSSNSGAQLNQVYSYQTPSGVISGIQWVPIEATQVLPSGAQPAPADFASMWQRGAPNMTAQDERNLQNWQKREEKMRRKEEKESQKLLREKELYGQSPSSASGEDPELRKAREKDAQRAAARERRKSFNGPSTSPYVPPAAPPAVGAASPAYPSSPYMGASSPNTPYGQGTGYNGYPFPPSAAPSNSAYPRSASGGQALSELERQMGDMEMSTSQEFERESATRPHKHHKHRSVGGNFGAGPYGTSSGTATSPYPSFNSTVPAGYPPASAPAGYPPAPAPAGYPSFQASSVTDPSRSRVNTPAIGSHSPLPGAYPPSSVHSQVVEEQKQLPAPDGFSRPPNQAQPYTPFEMMRIQDLDDFLVEIPKMPLVLQTHDTFHEDWIRLMQDISMAWAGRLPVPGLAHDGRYPKRSTLTADLIDLWNTNFLNYRGVDMILYKGRERRSGPQAGVVDLQFDDDDYSDSTTSTSSGSDLSGGEGPAAYGLGGGTYGTYGRQTYGPTMDSIEARQRQKEKKREKRRRRKEKKARRKERAREKKYTLYLTYIPPTPSPLGSNVIPAPGAISGYPIHGVTNY